MKNKKIKRVKTEEEKEKARQLYLRCSLSIFFVSIFLLLFSLGNGFVYFTGVQYVNSFQSDPFQFHVINVNQGDCFLIKLPDDKVLMVDCGDEEEYPAVKGYLKNFFKEENLRKIDYLILSHQDSDHLGSADKLLFDFSVDKVYRPKVYSIYEVGKGLNTENYQTCETSNFNEFTEVLHEKNIYYEFNEKGKLIQGEEYKIEFLSPEKDSYLASNDYSAVLMITYQDKNFLLTGDATTKIEQQLISEYGDYLKADVLKVSHHGSNTSTSLEFLEKVNPDYAILSVGKNSSGLPSVEVLNRLTNLKIETYSTKRIGNYAFSVSEGKILFACQKSPDKNLPLYASVTILLVCFVWTIKFERKPQKSVNMIVENSKI